MLKVTGMSQLILATSRVKGINYDLVKESKRRSRGLAKGPSG